MSYRTHTCGELRKKSVGKDVVLCGWVNRIRDHGPLIFVNIRDRYGITQVVFNSRTNPSLHKMAKELKNEWVLKLEGRVRKRPEGMANLDMPTGEIEVIAENIQVLNTCLVPPFVIRDELTAQEELRLRYRYIDLRREVMQKIFILRHKIVQAMREYLNSLEFVEMETPILTRSMPEGARDYLVPSRLYPGKFYCLAQSPQLYKQLLMVSGFDRYYQFARCFRDEDQRSDRQPEHTQIDIEMSFVNEDDIFKLVEGMFQSIFEKVLHKKIEIPFVRFEYEDAMNRFGSDKPDLRYGMEIVDITDITKQTDFKIFKDAETVRALNAKTCVGYSRKDIDNLEEIAKKYGAEGLLFLKSKKGVSGPLTKFLSRELVEDLKRRTDLKEKDLLLIIAGKKSVVLPSLGGLRVELAKRLNLAKVEDFKFCWVVNFPLFKYNEEENSWDPEHHIFTQPKPEDMEFLKTDPAKVRGIQYDLVCNGYELASGSIRNHKREIQEMVFDIIGLSREEQKKRFGFLLEALEYGAPPHGGIAPGLDRIVMLMAGMENIRDVTPFPKTLNAQALLEGAPAEVEKAQLDELGIKIKSKLK